MALTSNNTHRWMLVPRYCDTLSECSFRPHDARGGGRPARLQRVRHVVPRGALARVIAAHRRSLAAAGAFRDIRPELFAISYPHDVARLRAARPGPRHEVARAPSGAR